MIGRSFTTELHLSIDEIYQLLNPLLNVVLLSFCFCCCCFVKTGSYSAAHPGFEFVIPLSKSLK